MKVTAALRRTSILPTTIIIEGMATFQRAATGAGEQDDAFGHLAAFSSFCERMDKLGETLGGGKMCTFKLHILNCRAKEQHCRSGHPSFSLEYWVERMVQLVKKSVKYRTTAHPELIFVNTHLVRCAMTRARIHHPDCTSFDELLPNFCFKNLSGPGVDTPSEGDDSLLL
ncbi:hypothetical protein BSKO_02840 [Bryopsis sp. KO-2023]|nr:hypothetical protein BSKO_02840 [Bryopsis sp. KO-2023]